MVPLAHLRSTAAAEETKEKEDTEAEVEGQTVDAKTAAAATSARVGSVRMEDFSPTDVAHWLRSMANCIPNKILAEIRVCVVAGQIDGKAFANIIENCRVEVLSVDGLSPLHMNRVRRAWHLDCEKRGDLEPQVVQQSKQEAWPQQAVLKDKETPQFQQPVPQESHLQQLVSTQKAGCEIGEAPLGISGDLAPLSAAELVASTVEHLATWAGFDQMDALAELRAVLPPAILSGVGRAISRQAASNATEEAPSILESQSRGKPAGDALQGNQRYLAMSLSEDAPFSNLGRLERHVCTGGAF